MGTGLPRTGTNSLRDALERLLGGRCYHMMEIPGHPFELGAGWNRALPGDAPDWDQLLDGTPPRLTACLDLLAETT
ncbi:MAG: sulfotransferase [bacterium]